MVENFAVQHLLDPTACSTMLPHRNAEIVGKAFPTFVEEPLRLQITLKDRTLANSSFH